MVIAMKGASLHLGVAKTKEFTPTIFTVHIKLKHHNMFIFSDQGGREKKCEKDRCLQALSRAMPINIEKGIIWEK